MNNITPEINPEKKRLVFNILAILGFLAVIILVAWLSVQIVRFLPGAFSSLASIADSLYSQPQGSGELVIESGRASVETGQTIALSWEAQEETGTYTFSYGCTDGVTIKVRVDGTDRDAQCDTTYSLGSTTAATLLVNSTQTGEVSVPYTITFLRPNDTEPKLSAEETLIVTRTESTPPAPTSPQSGGEVATPRPTPVPDTQPPQPTAPEIRFETYSYVPESDPNGHVDLAVRLIDIGTVTENGLFTSRTYFARNTRGAVRFEVRNHGTKTSDTWTFNTNLPSGENYTSSEQRPLRPNERAVLTIGFPVGSEIGSVTLGAEINSDEDRTPLNDRFRTTAFVTSS